MAGINCSIVPCSALMEGKEFNFSNLYLHHTYGGPKPNQSTIINNNGSTGLGMTAVNNWAVYDGFGSDAKVVAHAHGLHIYAGDWHNSFSLVFENERLRGSTLQVMGVPVEGGEWAIVGGTGEFIMASGVIYKKVHERRSEGNIIELTIHGFCPNLKGTKCLATKVGPWGGNGGTPQDITETPKRLESITIRSGEVVDSISFSYFDQAGQKRVAGPWGGPGGNPNTIELASSEFLKEVSGTFGTYYGSNVITSIKFVTNVKTYGPFGKQNGTPFNIPVQNNSSVVGFFGRGGKYLDAVGVYVHPL
ncbi:mannose/glucose-specific lectin-like [Oryza glaberrima]|uniref:mannose/glucose-specific lectin-like n=1 Tax=Oryza glaberrima TaxID=4538 RepID=UPI00224C3ADA|nr:mannose/glucose-specific lectin-like [Oryza glaberrima]